MKSMTKKQKKMFKRILIGGIWFVILQFLPLSGLLSLTMHLFPFFILGYDVLRNALRNIQNRQIFDENFLMTVATIGAFCCGEHTEGVAVMLFYQVGELFQSIAVARSRQSIAELMDIRPDYANIEENGQLVSVDPEDIIPGQIIVIKPGERVPLDGEIIEGTSSLDTSALTGESLPRDVAVGEAVISGCINLSGLLRVQVSKPFSQSTVSRILELVEHSASKKAKAEHFITKFARYYTPTVVYAALALAFIPILSKLICSSLGLSILPPPAHGEFLMWVHRALIFLVVSCPCALVISIPLSFFGGIGGASRRGILVKGGNYLETLANASIVVFDKTGTLTQGKFQVTQIHPVNITEEELLTLAALAEQWSNHPIARSIQSSAPADLDCSRSSEAEELAGLGIKAIVDGQIIWAGNEKLMHRAGFTVPDTSQCSGTVVHIACQNYLGYLVVSDQVKPSSEQALKELKRCGIQKFVMLTGDAAPIAAQISQQLGIDAFHAGLLPDQKVALVEQLLSEKKAGEQLVFVGDGINDAPVLSRADIGIAMGAMGSDAAIEAADIVLMEDDLTKLADAVSIAKKTLSIVRQNIVLALGVKFLVLILTAFGLSNMWMAVFADVGVAVIAILNAIRMLRT